MFCCKQVCKAPILAIHATVADTRSEVRGYGSRAPKCCNAYEIDVWGHAVVFERAVAPGSDAVTMTLLVATKRTSKARRRTPCA